MVTDIPGQKRDLKKTRSVRPWFGHSHFGQKRLFKKTEKTQSEGPRYGHCRIGSKTWTLASVVHKTSPYWWMADARVRIVAFPITANMMAWNGRGQIQDYFFLDIDVRRTPTSRKKKKLNSPTSVPRHCICGDPEGNNSPALVAYQSGEVLMDHGHRRYNFWLVDHRKYEGAEWKGTNLDF